MNVSTDDVYDPRHNQMNTEQHAIGAEIKLATPRAGVNCGDGTS
jgi:hypothetical protein